MANKNKKQAVETKTVKAKGSKPDYTPRIGQVAGMTVGVVMGRQEKVLLMSIRNKHKRAVISQIYMKAAVKNVQEKRFNKRNLKISDLED
jgi:hypothetical protein